MSRDNLCITLEQVFEDTHPKACKLFRKIIDNYYDLEPEECMCLYDVFNEFCLNNEDEDIAFITEKQYTYLPH